MIIALSAVGGAAEWESMNGDQDALVKVITSMYGRTIRFDGD